MKNLGLCSIASIAAAFSVATAIASPAKTFNVVASFDGKNGDVPNGPLVQGANGNFYGTTQNGGAHNSNQSCTGYGCGTVFEVTPATSPRKQPSPVSNPYRLPCDPALQHNWDSRPSPRGQVRRILG
jgi:hypothetical protein